MTRSYTLGKRAKQQEDTRQRIVEATIALHQEVGGLNTTISAIAERAEVERATVYRHFPDERTLLQACTSHYLEQNQPPLPENWEPIIEPVERLRLALTEIYGYHRNTEVMMSRAASDMLQIPLLREVLAPMFAYWRHVVEVLLRPWELDDNDKHLMAAAIAHAVAFETWQSLARTNGLEDSEAVTLMVGMVSALAQD